MLISAWLCDLWGAFVDVQPLQPQSKSTHAVARIASVFLFILLVLKVSLLRWSTANDNQLHCISLYLYLSSKLFAEVSPIAAAFSK